MIYDWTILTFNFRETDARPYLGTRQTDPYSELGDMVIMDTRSALGTRETFVTIRPELQQMASHLQGQSRKWQPEPLLDPPAKTPSALQWEGA